MYCCLAFRRVSYCFFFSFSLFIENVQPQTMSSFFLKFRYDYRLNWTTLGPNPVSRACLKRLSTAGSWPWLSYATHLLSSTAAKAAILRHLLWLLKASTLTFETNSEGRTLFFLYGSLFRRSAIAWGKGLSRLLPQYNTVCIWMVLLLLLFLFFFVF